MKEGKKKLAKDWLEEMKWWSRAPIYFSFLGLIVAIILNKGENLLLYITIFVFVLMFFIIRAKLFYQISEKLYYIITFDDDSEVKPEE
ncbi:hypothetical protein KHQ81_12830 [Mycoplasmatota bacterium]|nr:hypothetical protein KHQ81_12830 [Mycoplasmatota bacterium]